MGIKPKSLLIALMPWSVFGGCLAVFTGLGSVIRVPAPPIQHAIEQRIAPALSVAQAIRLPEDGEERERLWLLDPAPLFLPVGEHEWQLPEATVALGGFAAQSFAPSLQIPELRPTPEILRPRAPATPLVAAGNVAAKRWFSGMARNTSLAPEAPIATRAGRVEVYRRGEGKLLAALDIASLEGGVPENWKPLELMVLIDSSGLASAPLVVESSGSDAVDERFRSIVRRELLPTLLLRAGVYRLEVGP